MFSFFTRSSKIHVDCFTYMPEIIDLFPVYKSGEKIPQWHKNVPPTFQHPGQPGKGTIRTCPGVTELFKEGITIQSWGDIHINWDSNTVNNPFGIEALPQGVGEPHYSGQWNDAREFQEYHHIKINSPWKFVEKTGVKFLFTNAFWNVPTLKYFIPNGLVEYKYQHTTNVNMWIPKSAFPKNVLIPAGTPLTQIIPLSEKEVVIHMHKIGLLEYKEKYTHHPFSFAASYYKRKKLIESKKCPL